MSDYRRDYTQNGIYFITAVLQDRSRDWLVRHIDDFRAAFQETQAHYPFETVAICIMPDHFHLILMPSESQADYSRIIQVLKTNFAKRLPMDYRQPNASQRQKGEAGVWQRRFWEHRIRDENDLARHIFYTYYNPVKHGLASAACSNLKFACRVHAKACTRFMS